MAAIQNDRDILLQAASVRVIPVYIEAAGIAITANTTTITGPTSGASTPASIILTAKLLGGLTGTVTWSKTGTGTLVPSGNTATITGSTMDFNSVVVTASIVVGGKTYSSQINLIKIKDQSEIQGEVNNLMNGSKDFVIRTDAVTVAGAAGTTTVPASVKLEAIKKNGLSGTVSWSIFAGVGSLTTYSGDTTYLTGSSITGNSVTVKASITASGKTYDAYVAINRLGAIASKDKVDLTSQVTGQLASGNVSGLGALALLNTVNLNTQTTGALNGATQVTNLGSLAYANAIAANQIGAGTLAAGVIYSGTINAENINGGAFTGKTFTGGQFVGTSFATAESGKRIVISNANDSDPHTIIASSADFSEYTVIRAGRIDTKSTSNISSAANIRSSNYVAMELECGPDAPHMVLKPIPTKPSGMWAGGIAYSSLHGFIFCNGVNWYKPAGWTVV